MRSRTSHAAKSGVGEHKARESESAQPCAVGKECVASTHPQIWPRNRKVPGPYFFANFVRPVIRKSWASGSTLRLGPTNGTIALFFKITDLPAQ